MTSDPAIAAGLRHGHTIGLRYRLALPRAALRGRDGARLGVGAGASLDFHDYRDYHPGDDLRHLDWSVYARSDKEVVKLFREEVTPHLDLILDCSRSMALADTPKPQAAATLAAALAVAAEQAHCSRAIWQAGARVTAMQGASQPPPAWPLTAFDFGGAPADALLRHLPPLRQHGVRIFISDLMWPADPAPLLGRLAGGAAAVTVIQLLAATEESPAPQGASRLEDVESGDFADLVIDAQACAAYTRALARHRETWSTACRACGAAFITITAETIAASQRLSALEEHGVLEVS